jgi:GAF domain-containing protein
MIVFSFILDGLFLFSTLSAIICLGSHPHTFKKEYFMFEAVNYPQEKKEFYGMLNAQLQSLTDNIPHAIANFSNASALLMQALEDINWAGFYFMKNGQLVLGPFQGKPACIEIPVGRGVCGTAVARRAVMLIPDVHAFPGHIACDGASNSEIVIPIYHGGEVIGVLDIDSPKLGRFDEIDKEGLQAFVNILEKSLL